MSGADPAAAETARMPRIALLADDLTSAGDGAAPFRAAGFPAHIWLDAPSPKDATRFGREGGLTAVDLDTRAGSVKDAESATSRAAALLAGADIVFKTVDSTVRGHLAVEIRAALAASGRHTALVAPAFPEEGRTTVGGVQLLGGVPVHATAFARDPSHPVHDADLRRLIPGAAVARDDLPRLDGVRPYVVADAVTDADLDRIVAQVPDPQDVLWVGSPGLAKALARKLGRLVTPGAVQAAADRGRGESDNAGDGSRRHRVLVVVGSLHPASREQAAQLSALIGGPLIAGAPIGGASAVEGVDPHSDGDAAGRAVARDGVGGDTDDVVQAAARALRTRGAALVCGPDEHVSSDRVPCALAEVVAQLARLDAFDALVVTGGQTARAVLLGLGARGIRLVGEPEPGVALGLLDRPASLPVLLKAGGFGDPRTLIRLSALGRMGEAHQRA